MVWGTSDEAIPNARYFAPGFALTILVLIVVGVGD
jgi:hypothetical protein